MIDTEIAGRENSSKPWNGDCDEDVLHPDERRLAACLHGRDAERWLRHALLRTAGLFALATRRGSAGVHGHWAWARVGRRRHLKEQHGQHGEHHCQGSFRTD